MTQSHDAARVTVEIDEQGRSAVVTVGLRTVTVYPSELEPGRLVVDIDGIQPGLIAVTINDYYVHGGPADRGGT